MSSTALRAMIRWNAATMSPGSSDYPDGSLARGIHRSPRPCLLPVRGWIDFARSSWPAASMTIPSRHREHRSISISRGAAYLLPMLRYHPACLFGEHRRPAMVAPMVDIHTNRFRGIHRTPIDVDGNKTGEKMMLGQAAGAVVKLSPDEEVTTVLGIGEGIESALSLPMLPDSFGVPVWACLSAGSLATFPVLEGVEVLWIAVDHDPSGAGERAAAAVVDRWTEDGREVFTIFPTTLKSDVNDIVRSSLIG
jgi:Toprim domain